MAGFRLLIIASLVFALVHGKVLLHPENDALNPLLVCDGSKELVDLLEDHGAEISVSKAKTKRRLYSYWFIGSCGWCDSGIDYFCLITGYCNPYESAENGGYRNLRAGSDCHAEISEIEEILEIYSSGKSNNACKHALGSKMMYECLEE